MRSLPNSGGFHVFLGPSLLRKHPAGLAGYIRLCGPCLCPAHHCQKDCRKTIHQLDKRIHKEGYALSITLCAGTKQFFLILLALYIASCNLTLSKGLTSLFDKIVIIGFFTQVALWGNQGISFYLDRYTRRNLTTDAAGVTTVTAMSYVARIFLWSLMLLIILDSLGFNVKTLIAVWGSAVSLWPWPSRTS